MWVANCNDEHIYHTSKGNAERKGQCVTHEKGVTHKKYTPGRRKRLILGRCVANCRLQLVRVVGVIMTVFGKLNNRGMPDIRKQGSNYLGL